MDLVASNNNEENAPDAPAKVTSPRFRERAAAWATIIAVPLAIVAMVLPQFKREGKSIGVYLTDKRPILTREADTAVGGDKDVQILFKDTEVASPWFSTFEVTNTGTIPITKDDVDKALRIRLSDAIILSVEIVKTIPPGVEATTTFDARDLTVQHKLLNQGDRLIINLVTDGEPVVSAIHSRISGVSAPTFEDVSTEVVASQRPYWTSPRLTGFSVTAVLGVIATLLMLQTLSLWWTRMKMEWFMTHRSTDAIMNSVIAHMKFGDQWQSHLRFEDFQEYVANRKELALARMSPESMLRKVDPEQGELSEDDCQERLVAERRSRDKRNAVAAINSTELLPRDVRNKLTQQINELPDSERPKLLSSIRAIVDNSENYESSSTPKSLVGVLWSGGWRLALVVFTWFVLASVVYSHALAIID